MIRPNNANTIKESAAFAMRSEFLPLVYLFQDTPLTEAWLFLLHRVAVCSSLPQFSVQGLNHSREAPACLVQVNITHPQALAHGLLDRRTKQMRWMSMRADGVEVQRTDEQRAALLSASSPAGHGRSRARGRGRVTHRQSAFKHRERRRAPAANPRHNIQVRFLKKS